MLKLGDGTWQVFFPGRRRCGAYEHVYGTLRFTVGLTALDCAPLAVRAWLIFTPTSFLTLFI
jgi:hypothetical protein